MRCQRLPAASGLRCPDAAEAAVSFGKSLRFNDLESGGGGNRTRVPLSIHGTFYVCSRLFEFHRSVPCRPGTKTASPERNLTDYVLDVVIGDSELVTSFWASPTNPLSRDSLFLGCQCEVAFGK